MTKLVALPRELVEYIFEFTGIDGYMAFVCVNKEFRSWLATDNERRYIASSALGIDVRIVFPDASARLQLWQTKYCIDAFQREHKRTRTKLKQITEI